MGSPEVRQTVVGDHNIFTATGDILINYHLPPAEAEERRILLQLAESVKRFWIQGVLERSLHEAAMLELRKEPLSDAVQHPWERILEIPGQSSQVVAGEKKIGEIFFETGSALLILGEPGAGKTVTLLELARELIARFETDLTAAAPVVLNLSTWQDKRRSLLGWIGSELKDKYYVPLRLSRAWLARSRLFLLLDGLDEVPVGSRASCVRAINEFLQNTFVPGIAVCSRRTEYTDLPERLSFKGAVCLQPLTMDQIDGYLEGGGSQLAPLRHVIRQDSLLQELAHSPLMLNVISLAYQGLPAETITDQSSNTAESRRMHLFECYVKRMFQRLGKAPDAYPQERTKRWLGWLAREMRQHSLTVFLLENLQPSWLPSVRQRWMYAISSRVSIALGWMILCWILTLAQQPVSRQAMLVEGISFTAITGALAGIVAGVIAGQRLTSPHRRRGTAAERFAAFAEISLYPLAMGTVFAFLTGPFFEPVEQFVLNISPGPETLHGWQLGAVTGIRNGLICGLMFGLKTAGRTADNEIRLSGTLRFSFATARKAVMRGGIIGAVVGVILCVIVVILQWQQLTKNFSFILVGVIILPVVCVVAAIIVGLLFAFVATTFSLFSPSDLPGSARPGQGVVLSAQNALIAGGAITVMYGIPAAILNALGGDAGFLQKAVMTASMYGVAAAVWYGGFDFIQHVALRFLLRRHGYIPKDYVGFLDYATRLIFLQKVGSGYIFVHRQLLDYIAGLEPPQTRLWREPLEASIAERHDEQEKGRPPQQREPAMGYLRSRAEAERAVETEQRSKQQKEAASKLRRRVVLIAGATFAAWMITVLILLALLFLDDNRVRIARDHGDSLVAQGKLPEALDAYEESLATAKHLMDQEKANTGFQVNLSLGYEKVGNVLLAQGKLPEALDFYQQSFNIHRTLAEMDASNADWQRNLSVSYEKVGNVLLAQGKLPEALDFYQHCLKLRRKIADQDKSNVRWQRDLAVSYERIGSLLGAQNKLQEALDAYQQELAIAKRLTGQDKSGTDWQRVLSECYEKVGNLLLAQGNPDDAIDGAIAYYSQAIRLDPNQYSAYYGRAKAEQINADFQGALGDLLHYVELAPDRRSTQDYPHLFVWLLRARQGAITEADNELSAYLEKRSDGSAGDWVNKIGTFLLGRIAEADFVAAADSSDTETDRGQHCEAWYYLGMKRQLAGDRKTAADYLRKCLATQETKYDEYAFAQAELKALGTSN